MKVFIIRTVLFAFVLIAVLCLSLFCVRNPSVHQRLLGALPDKHILVKNTKSPKMVFVGGSNLSFGLDSRKISEEFQMPVVNMGLHAGIGLRYMMNDALPYVKKNDIVVLIPEYDHFYSPSYYGKAELVALLLDIFPQGREYVSIQQWLKLTPYVVKYGATKILSTVVSLFRPKSTTIGIYDRRSFNSFGDAYIHWDHASEIVPCAEKCSGKETVNPIVLTEIKEFKRRLQEIGAELIILPPVYQECSFDNERYIIDKIETLLKENRFPFLTPPSRYRFAHKYILNTPYHLNKQGVDLRTKRVIEDLRTTMGK